MVKITSIQFSLEKPHRILSGIESAPEIAEFSQNGTVLRFFHPLVATPLSPLLQFVFAGFLRFSAVRGCDSPSNPSLASRGFALLNRRTPGLAPPL
jgi:hypothetical protein